jgi:hypothetical protein
MAKSARAQKRSKPAKKTPAFRSETAEREFWETTDSTDYVD